MRTPPSLLLLLASIPALLMALSATLTWPLVYRWHGDPTLYDRYAQQLLQGAIPYRDFTVEYPPLALLAFVIPRLMAFGRPIETSEYISLLLVANALFCVVTTFITLQIGQATGVRSRFVVGAMTVLMLILSPVLPWRYDIFPTMLSALGMLAAVRGQSALAGWWLGTGIAAKLYPAVLGPFTALQLMVARRWRAFAWLLGGGILALVVTVLPFYILAGNALWTFISYHEQRGLQIESVGGGIVTLGSKLGWTHAETVYNFGAQHLTSPWADVILPLLTPLLIAAYTIVLFVAYRHFRTRPDDKRVLVSLSAAALLVFIITNKVFSPQYLVWLLPFIPLLNWRQVSLFAAICVVTVVIFPFNYEAMLGLELWTVVLLNVRNAATIALLVWIVFGTWRTALNPAS